MRLASPGAARTVARRFACPPARTLRTRSASGASGAPLGADLPHADWAHQEGSPGKTLSRTTIRNVTMTPPPWPAPPTDQRRHRRPLVLPVLTSVLSVVAFLAAMVALTRPAGVPPSTFTAAQRAAAKSHLCERYKLAADVEHIETNGSDAAFARISLTNGAVILAAAAADPALASEYRDAALELAQSYQTMAAASTKGPDDAQFKAALKAVAAEEGTLEKLCAE